jgi:ABC-type transport system involved in multi-copper enzyme maturation permease subunit
MMPLFTLSLRQMSGKWRLIIILVLAAIPVGLGILLHSLVGDDENFTDDFPQLILDGMLIGVILPIVVMTLATAAFGNEVEDRTLNVLVLKPISRIFIVLPKYFASVVIGGGILVAAVVIIVVVALSDGGATAVIAAVVAVATGVITYAALFTWLGLISAKALGFALVYVFLWEQFLTRFISGIKYFSVREYSLSIMNQLDGDTFGVFDSRVIEIEAAITGAVVVTLLFVGLTIRRLQRMDVP